MNRKEILCIVDSKKSYDLLWKHTKSLSKTTIVTFDKTVKSNIQSRGLKCNLAAEYLNKGWETKIDENSIAFAKNWYKGSYVDKEFFVGNINIAELVELNLMKFFRGVLLVVESVMNILEQEKPKKIILCTRNAIIRNALFLIKDKNIPVINLSARHVLMGVFSKTSFENHLSRNLLKSSLKKYFGVLQNLSYMLEEKKTEKSGKIAFIGVPRHLRQLLPVAKIFIDSSYHPLILSSGITRLSEFRKYGMEATYLDSYLTIKILKILHKDLQKTIENWVSTLQEKISQERLVYNEIPLWPIIKDQFPTLCVSLFSEAFKHIKIFEEIIKEENIQLAVFGNQVCLKERTAVAVMNTYGIPTLLIQDGIIGGSYTFAPLHTTKMAVWGDLSRNNLSNCGISHEKLIITGCPRFDDLVNDKAKSFKKEIFSKLDIKKKMNGFMVFATNPIPDIKNAQLISNVYESSKSFPNIKLVVKLHPGETGNLQREIAKRLKVTPIIIKNIDLYHLLNTAKLIITYHSTVGLEAMIMDKLVIIVNLFEDEYPVPYVSSGAAIGVYKTEDLVPAIKRVLFDKETQQELAKRRKEFVYEYAYKMDGKASERVADLIEKMIEEGKDNKLM